METFSALLAICSGNSPVTSEFLAQSPVMRSFDVFLNLRPNERVSKQWWGWWFETSFRPLWCHCNVVPIGIVFCFVHFRLSLWCPMKLNIIHVTGKILLEHLTLNFDISYRILNWWYVIFRPQGDEICDTYRWAPCWMLNVLIHTKHVIYLSWSRYPVLTVTLFLWCVILSINIHSMPYGDVFLGPLREYLRPSRPCQQYKSSC